MDALRDEFDIVLVDSPPAGLIVDAIEIARYCDGAVIVVEYNRGRVQDVARSPGTSPEPAAGCWAR